MALQAIRRITGEADISSIDSPVKVSRSGPVCSHVNTVNQILPLQTFWRHLVLRMPGFISESNDMALNAGLRVAPRSAVNGQSRRAAQIQMAGVAFVAVYHHPPGHRSSI